MHDHIPSRVAWRDFILVKLCSPFRKSSSNLCCARLTCFDCRSSSQPNVSRTQSSSAPKCRLSVQRATRSRRTAPNANGNSSVQRSNVENIVRKDVWPRLFKQAPRTRFRDPDRQNLLLSWHGHASLFYRWVDKQLRNGSKLAGTSNPQALSVAGQTSRGSRSAQSGKQIVIVNIKNWRIRYALIPK